MAKKKRISKEDLLRIERSSVREDQKKQGALDGRFREKVVPSKKEKDKRKRKKDVDLDEEEV